MYRRWVSVKRSQMVGFSSVAWVSSRTPSPKRSAAFEMISRSANSCPRAAATVRPISLPRLPAVSEMARILMACLLPETQMPLPAVTDRKSTRLNSSHGYISYAVFCLKKKKNHNNDTPDLNQSLVPDGLDGAGHH